MKLLSLSIQNFGKLHHYDLTLDSGLNTICEENGWGKTTLAAFLKAMFYGLSKSTKRDLDENEFKRYTPWQGGTFGGNLVFSSEKGTFRVERTFEPESFALYDTATELPSSAYTENLGEELFGIDAEGFEESVFLSARALKPTGKNDSVHAKLTGIDEIHDISNYENAHTLLDERAKDYKKRGGGGYIGDTEARIHEIKESLTDARGKMPQQESCERELADTREQIAQIKAEEKALQTALLRAKQVEDARTTRNKLNDLLQKKEELERRFTGELPAREELAACRKIIAGMDVTRAELATLGLNMDEQHELVALSGRFPTGAPSSEELNEKLRLATALRAEQTSIGRALDTAQKERQAAEDQLARLPSHEELSRANVLLASRKTTEKSAKRSGFSLFFLCSLLLFPAGTFLLIFGFAKSVSPLWIAGASALAVAVVCLILHLTLALRQKRAGTAELAGRNAEINALLNRLGLSASEDPLSSIALLLEQRKNAESARVRANEICADLTKKQRLCAEEATALRAYLAGFEIAGADPESGLFTLAEYARNWDALCKKQKSAASAEAQKKAALAADAAQVKAFLDRLPPDDPAASEKDRLDAMEELLRDHETLSRMIADRKNDLQTKLDDLGITEPSLLDHEPDPAALAERHAELESILSGLQGNETRLSALLTKWQSVTEQIPEWEEELDRRNEILKEQKKRYDLLCKTRDLLEKAHSDLTTRYLEPTRRNFANYLTLLAGKNVPKATLAADFSVSVLDGGFSRKMESYSRGWRDLLQFCVRLSLIDALYAEGSETPFLLLDDPFSNLDEERLAAAKELLARLAGDRQILYLVCHGDRV